MSLPSIRNTPVTASMTGPARPAHRPWWIWTVPGAVLLAVVVSQNTFLFSVRLHEQSDSAADSILVRRAMRLDLLVGHYSRYGFHHPGPAYLYLLALGQGLMYNLLHVVPTPWNGQFFAAFALSGALASMAVAIVYGVTGRVTSAAAAFAVICLLIINHPDAAVSVWPPSLFILTYLVFLLAAASVAARRAADLWILALTGWLLVHGYAPFLLLFVPLTLAGTAVFALWPDRHGPLGAIRGFLRDRRRAWIPAALISVVFVLPIVVNLVLHWPGEFGSYLSYSSHSGGYRVSQVIRFMAWYWAPHNKAWPLTVACVLVAAAVLGVTRIAGRRLPGNAAMARFSLTLAGLAGQTSLAFGWYAADGSAGPMHYFIGYFFWAVPFALVMITAIQLAETLGDHLVIRAGSLAAALALLAVLISGMVSVRADVGDNNSAIPGVVATMAVHSKGHVSVLGPVADQAWYEVTGILLQAQRAGVPVCVAAPAGGYRVVLREFRCDSSDLARGVWYTVFAGPHRINDTVQAVIRAHP